MAVPDTVTLYHTPSAFHCVLTAILMGHGNMKVSGLFLSVCLLLMAQQVTADGHLEETETLGEITFECEEGWRIYNGNCYKVVDVPMNYESASLTCLGQGGFLYYAENEIEYFDFVAKLLPKTIWFDYVEKEGKWMIQENEVPFEFISGWGINQPAEDFEYTVVNPTEKLMLTDGEKNMFPFVCKRRACRKGHLPCDLASKCIPQDQICNGVPECVDGADENNCPSLGTWNERLTSESGSFSTGSFVDFQQKTWSFEAPIGKRIRLFVPQMELETNIIVIEVWSGGPTFQYSEMLQHFTGRVDSVFLYSTTNFLKVRMYAKDLSSTVGSYTFGWTTKIPQIPDGVQVETATDTWKNVAIPFASVPFKPKSLELWWRIEAPEGRHMLYYLILSPETGFSEEDMEFKITADNWQDGLEYRDYYVSSTNILYVKSHFIPKNGAVSLAYKLGCELETNIAFGRILSSWPIPNDFECSWTVTSGEAVSRGTSLKFHKLELEEDPRQSPGTKSQDKLMVYADQSDTAVSEFLEGDIVHAPDGHFRIKVMTDAAFMSQGFVIGFGRDCEPLKLSDETTKSTEMTYIFENVTLSCPTGYKFQMEKYKDEESVTLTCHADGWKINGKDPGTIPECKVVYCGPPSKIENGGVNSTTAVTYNGVATYFCNEGFKEDKELTATCDENGDWIDVPTCKSSNCTALSQNMLPNGKFVIIRGNNFSNNNADFNTVVEFSCDEGYEILGSVISYCNTEKWTHTDNPPSCEKIACTVPHVPNSDIPLEGPTTKTLYQETYTVTCNANYRFSNGNSGPESILCQANGTFDQSLVCEDINECVEGTDSCVDASTVCMNEDGGYVCNCRSGFKRDTDFNCFDIKECDYENGYCSSACVEEAGSYHCECGTGYQLFEGDAFNGFYLPSGETGLHPGDVYYVNHTCVPVQCPILPSVINGNYLTNTLDDFHFTDTVKLQCNDGYKVNRTGTTITSFESTCNSGGTWNELYSCEARKCSLPSAPRYGEYDKTAVLFGETVTLTCNLTELKRKELKAFCLYDSDSVRFAGDDITQCPEIDCGDPVLVMPVGGNFNNGVKPSTTTYFGASSSFTFTCDSGFDVTGASNDESNDKLVKCKENGRWDLGTLACTGKMCKDPGTPGDAQQVVNGYEIDSKLYFTCNRDGFTITTNYTCDYNSFTSTAEWSDNLALNLPECKDTENPTFSGNCDKTFNLDAVKEVSFTPGFATDNFGTLKSFSMNEYIRNGDRILVDTLVTYTATDFEDNEETCTINFNVIDRNVKPVLNCLSYKTIQVSTRQLDTYNTSSDITVSGGELVMRPSSIAVNVSKIGTAESVTATATNQYGTETTCTFMVDFVADACFEEQLFEDKNAQRNCSGSGSNLECTSICTGNNVYSDRSNTKTFKCSGNGVWDYTSTQPNERFCLNQENAEYEVDVDVIHTYGTISGNCGPQYKDKLKDNVGRFRTQIANQCNGQQWSVSVVEADNGNSLFEFEATLKLTLISLSATVSEREECVDNIKNNALVFNVAGNELSCSGTYPLTANLDSITAGTPAQRCPNTAFKLVDDICLSYGPGQYFNTETDSVANCPTGQYQDSLNQISCKTCPTEQYPNSDETGCQATCSNGFISASGFYPCTPCPVNEYWTGKSECTPCPDESTTVGIEGAASSSQCYAPCPAGTYSRTGYNDSGCSQCPVNFYQDEATQQTCKRCNRDQVTASSGSTTSSDCTDIGEVCDAAYCNDNGDCSYEYHRRVCSCKSSYYGNRCQNMYHICDGNPCNNGATCIKGDGPSDYSCSCRTDLDVCEMTVYNETKIGTHNPAPYDTVSVTNVAACEAICLGQVQCKDASYVTINDGVLCILYNVTLDDSQLEAERNEGDKHLRKNCKIAFMGDRCQQDTYDNCLDAGCSENSECMEKIDGFECICPSAGAYTGQFCDIANDPCNPDPCKFGSCKAFGSVRYECTCQDGYEGIDCERDIDECTLHPLACSYGGTCNDLRNSYSCSCEKDFSGRYCENTPDFCSAHDCSGINICYNSLNNMEGVCECNADLFEPRYRCNITFTENNIATDAYSNTVGTALPVSSFEDCVRRCQDNRDCVYANYIMANGQNYCALYNDSYQGKFDETSTLIYKNCDIKSEEAYACDKVKEPCDDVNCNNGTCQSIANGLQSRCNCDAGFTGSLCQHSIDDCVMIACQNGASCVDGHQTYTCKCAEGYEGDNCEVDIDDCPGCCNTTYASCDDKIDGYECRCNPGYTGEDCDIEINECASNPCQHGGDCVEKVNGFECKCTDGWEGDMCERKKDNCLGVRTCLNDGECFSLEESSFCRCEGGATGENCENAKLLCGTLSVIEVCLNEGVCMNTGGTGARCDCPEVYNTTRCYMEDGISGKSGGNRQSYTIPYKQGLSEEDCKLMCLKNRQCVSVTYSASGNNQFCLFYTADEEMLTDSDGATHFRRNCPIDYSGASCELVKDSCRMNPCKHGGKCMPQGPAGYTCECETGYSGPVCEVVADPCESNPCRGQASCQNTPTDYICQCPEGKVWAGTYCQNSRTDYTLFVNAYMGETAPMLQTTFRLNSKELSIMMRVRVHFANRDLALSSLFSLVVVPELDWTFSLVYDFSLSVSHYGIYVVYGTNPPAGILFSEDFGNNLFDGEWHYVGISINSVGMMTATIDALHLDEPVDTGRNFSLNYNAQLFLGYGYTAEYQFVEVYNTLLDRSVFSNALTGVRPEKTPIQAFTNYLLPYSAKMNKGELTGNLAENQNLVVPNLNCSQVEDVYHQSGDRLTSISSITRFNNIKDDVESASGLELSYEHSLDSTLMWGYYPVIITGQDAVTKNYGECRFNLYVRYNEVCPVVNRDSSVRASPCSLNGNTNSVCGVSCTDDSKRLAAATPNYIICGPLGVDDFRMPFADVVLPSCMTPQSAVYQLDVVLQFTLDIDCAVIPDSTLSQLDTKIRQNFFNDISSRWTGLCSGGECTNLGEVQYKCDTLYSRRVTVTFPLELTRMTIEANGGGEVGIVDALKIIILIEEQLDLSSVAGATLIKPSVEINQVTVCPSGYGLQESSEEPLCVPCSEGMYLKDGKCMPCDYGQYQDETAQEKCKPCGDDKTTYQKHSKMSSDCKDICKAGFYFDEADNICKACERHFYQPEDGKNFCLPCEKEYKTVEEGSDSAADCKADCLPGQERSAETGLCKMCERGSWRSLEFDDCQPCPPDKTTFEDQRAETIADCEIDICSLGEYFDVDEKLCKECAFGSYQDKLYMLECKPCPGNTTTREMGSVNQTQCIFYCPPGYEKDGIQEVCLACERGEYKDNEGVSKFEDCKQCPTQTTDMKGATSRDNCSIPVCGKGQIINDNNRCEECHLDYFSDAELPTTQTACLRCDSLAACETCDDLYGTIGIASTSDQCMRYCEAGEFLNGDTCDSCVRGYYKNNAGNTRFNNCTKCPDKDNSETTTDIEGADDVLACSVYKCAAGSIHTNTGCDLCPLNTFQPIEHPLSYVTCQSCQPKDGLNTNTITIGTVSQEDCIPICDAGKYLENRICKSCPRGTFKDNIGNSRFGNCTDCPGELTTEDDGADRSDLCNIPQCTAGSFLVNKECKPCPLDQYSEVVNPNSDVKCIECPTTNGVVYGTEVSGADSPTACKPTCPGGKQVESGVCTNCPIGTFKGDDNRFGECVSCNTVRPGYVTSGTGSKTSDQCDLRDCQPGEYIVGTACGKCLIGFYQNQPRKTSCIDCGENLSTDGAGKTSQDDCQIECGPGLQGTDRCTECPAGKFKPDAGYANCQDCPEDFTSNQARTACDVVQTVAHPAQDLSDHQSPKPEVAVPPAIGKEYKEIGSTKSCEPCDIGFFKNQPGNSQQCTLCNVGTTTNGTGQASCDLLYCEAGKFKLESSCVFCPVGTYKSGAGNLECSPCPDKRTTGSVTGAISSTQCDTVLCDPGKYRKTDQKLLCTPCEVGKYQPDAGQTSCEACPNDEITLEGGQISEDACVPECLKGQEFNTTTKECTLCPTGTYKDRVGNLELCQLCDQDTTTAGPGSTQKSDCSENVCPPGKFYTVQNNKIVCIDCPRGRYSDRIMQEECTLCPNSGTTLAEGSNSEDDCIDNCQAGFGYETFGSNCVVCPRGQFNDKQGKNPNTCKLCPAGKTNSQKGSTSCSFPAPVLIMQSIQLRATVEYRIAIDECSDTNGINLILDIILELLRNLFQSLTSLRFNSLRQFCSGSNCDNLIFFSSSVRCQRIPGLKRTISHEIEFDIAFKDISEFITDPEDGNANINAVEIISQIFTLYGQNLSNSALEIFFTSFDNVTTTDLCVIGQELISDSCTLCRAGQYGSAAGTCTQCPVDYYQDETGQLECKKCPDKTDTENKEGSSAESDCISICQAGFEFDNATKSCSECELGFYKEEAGNDDACTQCRADRTTERTGSTSANDCTQTVCLAGQYYYVDSNTGDIKCNFCDIGFYNPNTMVDTCEQCPDDKTTLLTGRKAVKECIRKCNAGTGFTGNTSLGLCMNCPKGQYNDAKGSNPNMCKLCPTGKTNLQQGQASCSIDITTPTVERRITISMEVTYEISISSCENEDLNIIRTTIFRRIREVLIIARNSNFNQARSFCTDNCSNAFAVFPDNACREKTNKTRRRKRALTHELVIELQFRNVTEGTVDSQTDEALPTKEVITQVLESNSNELSPSGDNIIYKSADTPVSIPVCSDGQQPDKDDCVPCGTGKYSTNGETCLVCPKDTYQDEQGQSSCKDCPARTFYDSTGATASSACGSWCANNPTYCNNRGICSDTGRRTASCSCNEKYEGATCATKKEPQSDLPAILGGAIGGGGALLFIILIAVGLIYKCSRDSPEKSKRSYRDPEYVQNGAFEGTYDNFGYHDGQVRPVAPYPSIGYPALGYKPDGSFEEGSYGRPYRYLDGDDNGQAEDTHFMWTA